MGDDTSEKVIRVGAGTDSFELADPLGQTIGSGFEGVDSIVKGIGLGSKSGSNTMLLSELSVKVVGLSVNVAKVSGVSVSGAFQRANVAPKTSSITISSATFAVESGASL